MNIRYSRRHGRKLKPNRAQRQRTEQGWQEQSFATRIASAQMAGFRLQMAKAKAAPLPAGKFLDCTGIAHVRESQGQRQGKTGLTVRRTGPRPVDTKRAARKARLATTLNAHAPKRHLAKAA